MTSHEKLWLTVGLVVFVILHLWGARMIAATSALSAAPIAFASTGD